ncbi:uncharacterized protein [Prorops nasuta]|uniref:uncharacterized protein n=1 Tax=Prorops nasuta TaxID=863751 RepID=UPI0034CED6BD
MSRVKLIHQKRTTLKTQITLLVKAVAENKYDTVNLRLRSDRITQLFHEFEELQTELSMIAPEDERMDDFIDVQDKYYDLMTTINSIIRLPTPQPNTIDLNATSIQADKMRRIKLPVVELPKFEGQLECWLSYKNTFIAMIDSRDDINDLQKFLYLKDSLRGEALNKISIYNASAENYKNAWKLLTDSYEKKRILTANHLDAILDLPVQIKSTHKGLTKLVDDMRQHVNMLASLGIIPDENLLVRILERALPPSTRSRWEETLSLIELPTLEGLYTFISETAFRVLTIEQNATKKKEENAQRRPNFGRDHSGSKKRKTDEGAHILTTTILSACLVCSKQNHPVARCPQFGSLNVSNRWETVKKHHLCRNCLRKHPGRCNSLSRCRKCNAFHHTMLHNINHKSSIDDNTPSKDIPNIPTNSSTDNDGNQVRMLKTAIITLKSLTRVPPSQLMMSALVRVKNKFGQFRQGRALLDTCATAHFITKEFVDSLGLTIRPLSVTVGAINEMATLSEGLVEMNIYSIHKDFKKSLSFLVIPKIADLIPNNLFPRNSIKIPPNMNLADPHFHVPRPIDLLIGSGATLSLFSIGQMNLSKDSNDLVLQKTQLGWVVAGGKTTARLNEPAVLDNACENQYSQSTSRDSTGRYTVRLPFRIANRDFGDTRSVALRRFYGLQKRFDNNPSFKSDYERIINEYIECGHMSLAIEEVNDSYYLPHHAVIKATSETTKMRVVFDASAKGNRGISLNDSLLVGPTIQNTLFEHLVRFRTFKYVLVADIEKMYRQIWIHPEDRKYQRILWYNQGRICSFQLNTVTFGVSSAPFLAIRTLHRLADDEQKNYPSASKVLKNHLYVDDLLTGSDDLDEILIIRDELINLLKKGGFNMRQWASNESRALTELRERTTDHNFLINLNSLLKTLGVSWNAQHDYIFYAFQFDSISETVSKLQILSQVAKICDPLQLLGPILFTAKVMMQQCWKTKISWDESLPSDLHSSWLSFSKQLPLINQIKFERRMIIDKPKGIQLHGFCDASKAGYGACLYIRSRDRQNKIFVNLVCAKSRVAPIKEIMIPRLELCGALTLARLYRKVKVTLNIKFDKIIFWSDSTIVLHWLKKSPQELKVFEANRISEIQTLNDFNVEWRHVRTDHNPADAISRGQYPNEFMKNHTWFKGPGWLCSEESYWPNMSISFNIELPGLRKTICLVTNTNANDIFLRFSTYSKLIRVIAYCLRFLTTNKNKGLLSADEINTAELKIIKLIQFEQFSDVIRCLKENKEIKVSKFSSLYPFINEHDILCVGGRLRHANIPMTQKHSMLLPSYHHVTDLLIRETHERNYHSGVQSTLYALRLRFWIFNGKIRLEKLCDVVYDV